MELHPYRLDHGLTDVSQLDAADRPSLPPGTVWLLPANNPASGPLQRLFREQGLDVYLMAAMGAADPTSERADDAMPAQWPSAASTDAQPRAFTTPKSYGQALDQACQAIEQTLATREEAASHGRADASDATTKLMRAALRVLTSTAEMRAELAMYRGLLLAG